MGSSLCRGDGASGANFISREAFAYAEQRVADKKECRDLTIDEFRLFNNMLSSMPMCFNLFADFRAAVKAGCASGGAVLAGIFASSPIRCVEDVVVEMIPQPTNQYIDDKTAWDAAVIYTDKAGRRGLVSIETKYTDKLSGDKAAKEGRKMDIAKRLGLFSPKGLRLYRENGFDQVARNLLLTLAYADKHELAYARNYVLAPKDDEEAPAAVDRIRERLATPYKDSIEMLPLETVVERGLACADALFADHLRQFRKRYLDFSQIAHL